MLNKDITHSKTAETDRQPPHGARKPKYDDEFDNLYIDAQKIIALDPVLAPAANVPEKRTCQIRVGMPCRTFAQLVDPWRFTGWR